MVIVTKLSSQIFPLDQQYFVILFSSSGQFFMIGHTKFK